MGTVLVLAVVAVIPAVALAVAVAAEVVVVLGPSVLAELIQWMDPVGQWERSAIKI